MRKVIRVLRVVGCANDPHNLQKKRRRTYVNIHAHRG